MPDNWLDELQQIRDEDAVQQKQAEKLPTPKIDLSVLSSHRDKSAADLLKHCNAHNLLRRVQHALLAGKGVIDLVDQSGQYDRAMTLMWQGPVSAARRPDPEDPEEYHYIVVGVRAGKLYVNSHEVTPMTPEALKTALVKAAKKPGHTQRHKKS